PEFVDVETGKYPPLGLLYVAGSVLEQGRHQVEILDCQLEESDYSKIESEIRNCQPELIGIQATTFTLIDVIKLCQLSKEVLPGVPVVIGGPHTFLYPRDTINLPGVDYVVLGEGEQNFPAFLDCLEVGGDLARIKGLVYRQNGRILHTGLPDLIENLDNLPFPPRELLPYEKYYSVLAQRTPITTMMSSRGCPYRCTFCARPHLGKKWRARSPENIVAEMKRCVESGIGEIFFYDDTFNINAERVTKICELIIGEKLDVLWDIRARVDLMTPELLKQLARAGCRRIHYGVEAGTEPMIKVLRKEVDLSRVREVFRYTRRTGITTLGYFMIGNPGETREQILATIKFALELDADYVHFSVTTPFPGTELYHQGLKSGVIQKDYWQEFASNPQVDFVPPVWEEKFTREELIKLLRYAYKKFYLRPKYILSQLLRVKTVGELMRKARAGISLAVNV
ncbi:MAG: B12-binding domain-containing radical SAM protein, partial [Candidatus Sumerlaeia bacterium]|nr:B12-binding domain-containing radical SAM protein [Candidatus Sumerlaeia bacterium]